jgi:hypothetical protein
MKDTVIELLVDGVLVQSIVAVVLIGAIVYMYVNELAVPDELVNIGLIVVGFLFGSQSQAAIKRGVTNAKSKL